jgi:transcriptional regulator GlxA family with amidase domain
MTVAGRAAPADPAPFAPRAFWFLLGPRFSMIAFASAIEPLRLANRLSGRQLYAWRLISEDGREAACSNGARLLVDGGLEDAPRGAAALVCTGLDPQLAATRPVLSWLRRQARGGVTLGAVCTGAAVLARAGLLEGRRCAIHWENRAAFLEAHPDIPLTARLYEIEGDRLTCAGGAAPADMMLELIQRDHGAELAGLVGDQMIMASVRRGGDGQRLSVPARIGVRHPKLIAIIHRMEENVEEPITPPDLAREAGLSVRQLERLFRRYLDRSPKRYYMELRLERARGLLMQTDMSVINVALACGFTSPSHFSKCYRARYGRTPYRERGEPTAAGGAA